MVEPISLQDISGVGPTTSKLRQIRITTIEALAVTPVREIADKTDIGFEKDLQMIQEARKLVRADWKTAKELWEKRRGMLRCSTGSQKLGALLGDGFLDALLDRYGDSVILASMTYCVFIVNGQNMLSIAVGIAALIGSLMVSSSRAPAKSKLCIVFNKGFVGYAANRDVRLLIVMLGEF